jgi:alkaline phosphatase
MTRTFTSALAIAAAFTATAQAQDLPQAGNEWFAAGQSTIQAALERQQNTNRALNVILMISDGNGVGTNYASRLFAGQEGGGFGDEFVQAHEAFPHLALVKTYNVNAQTPDSAGTGTAMMSGIKTDVGVVGVTADVNRGDCSTLPGNTVLSMNEIMTERGKATGIVSTARITHATPASAYAKSVDRNYEDSVPEGCDTQADIATQLIDAMQAGIIDVAMGGGRRHFLPVDVEGPEGDTGRREDGENLVDRANELGASYVFDSESFEALDLTDDEPILGLFEDSHMQYEADRDREPSLAEMTAAAIAALEARGGENGFFLQVEAGRVDHANHAGNLARVVRDQQAFAEAVAMADEMTDDADTLIVVTADHEHAITFNGYCGRGSDILGLCMAVDEAGVGHSDEANTASDGLPYTVAGFLNGPGSILVESRPEDARNSAFVENLELGAALNTFEDAGAETDPMAVATRRLAAASTALAMAASDLAAASGPQEAMEESAPIFSGTRPMVTQEEATDLDYLQQALIPMSSETHTGEDVAVYAKGPFAHLLDGTIEQNVIFHVMHHAATAE